MDKTLKELLRIRDMIQGMLDYQVRMTWVGGKHPQDISTKGETTETKPPTGNESPEQ